MRNLINLFKQVPNALVKQGIIFCVTFFSFATLSFANPEQGSIAAGDIQIETPTENSTVIRQTTPNGIINWKSFNIDQHQKTAFIQPRNGITLNRVVGSQNPSQIYGTLTATGKIILVNSAGVFFGPSARVNVGGIIATTANISDKNFLAGQLIFDEPSPNNSAIVNQGTIIARKHGLVALMGNSITNEGIIQANLGQIALASGSKFTVDLTGNGLINFTVDAPAEYNPADPENHKPKTGVTNSGSLIANGGTILMTAKTGSKVLDDVINTSGVVEAKSFSNKNGVIIFSAEGGDVEVSGKIDVSGKKSNETGGTVKILGDHVEIASSARIDASGDVGGGDIFIGGAKYGMGSDINAQTTTVQHGAYLSADAITNGNGGEIVVWSDGATVFQGTASAKGGQASGDGGFIETSGHYLDVSHATVNTLAPHGQTGTWLLDPIDVYIVAGGADTNSSLYNTTYQPNNTSTSPSIIGVDNITTALATNNVLITTTAFAGSGGSGNGDIFVNTPISWSADTNLTLSAYRNIILNSSITNNTSTTAELKLQADNTGTGVGTVCGNGSSLCSGSTPTGQVSMAGGSNLIKVFYNPTVFGTPDTIYSGGDAPTAYMLINSLGDENDTTTRSLASLSNGTGFWTNNFALAADIDATATNTWNGGEGFSPIGSNAIHFTGNFDGQDYSINNLYINVDTIDNEKIGLFGHIGSSTTRLENLGIHGASITVTNAYDMNVGILAGEASIVNNVITDGTLIVTGGNFRVGGLLAISVGPINNSSSSATITIDLTTGGWANVGGLVGLLHPSNSLLNGSYFNGAMTVNYLAGSLGLGVGGLAGVNQSGNGITNSYNNGLVTFNYMGGDNSSIVTIGGIVGDSDDIFSTNLNYVLNTGSISVTGTTGSGTTVGALVGVTNVDLVGAFWDTNTSNQVVAVGSGPSSGATGGCFGCSTDFSNITTYSNAGWDIGAPGSNTAWQMVDGRNYYPRVSSEGLFTVSGVTTPPAFFGDTVNLVVDGAIEYSFQPNVGGDFQLIFTTNSSNLPLGVTNVSNGQAIMLYSAGRGTLVFESDGQSHTSADLTDATLYAGLADAGYISNSILANAIGSIVDSNILYTATGNDITLNSGTAFQTNNQWVFDGDLSISNGTLDFSNTIKLAQSSSVNLTSSTVYFSADINGQNNNFDLQGAGANNNFSFLNNLSFVDLSTLTLTGSGTDTLTFNSNNATQTWDINATGISELSTISGVNTFNFSGIQAITGGDNEDVFTVTATPLDSIDGGGGDNTLTYDLATPANVTINTVNGGTGGGVTLFSNMQNLSGANAGDSFIFTTNGSLTGTLSSVGGTLDFSSYAVPVTINLQNNTSNIGSIAGFTTFIGNDGTTGTNSTIIGSNAGDSWTINGANSISVNGMNFTGFGNITGGSGTNTFIFSNNATLSGTLNGGSLANNNSINASNYGTTLNLSLTGKSNNVWNIGQLSAGNAAVLSFINVTQATGNGGTLNVPAEAVTSIVLTGNKIGYIGDPFYFYNFDAIQVTPTTTSSSVSNLMNYTSQLENTTYQAIENNNTVFVSVSTNINEIIITQAEIDVELEKDQRFGCF